MTQRLTLAVTLDLQIDVIAELSLFLLVFASVPAGILLTDRREGQRWPIDFGPFWCDWYSFRCFQHHPGDIYGSSLGRHRLAQWTAQIDRGVLCHLYCLQDFALWKGDISLQDMLFICECYSKSYPLFSKLCFGHQCSSSHSRFHNCTPPHLIFLAWSRKENGFRLHQASFPRFQHQRRWEF